MVKLHRERYHDPLVDHPKQYPNEHIWLELLERVAELERRLGRAYNILTGEGDTCEYNIGRNTEAGSWIDAPTSKGTTTVHFNPMGMILLARVSGATPTEYSANGWGLNHALAAAVSGDMIWLPRGNISVVGSSVVVVPPNVTIIGQGRYHTEIHGALRLSNRSSIEFMTVVNTVYSWYDAAALYGPSGWLGTFATVWGCYIGCSNHSSGGYGVISDRGALALYDSVIQGSTAPFRRRI